MSGLYKLPAYVRLEIIPQLYLQSNYDHRSRFQFITDDRRRRLPNVRNRQDVDKKMQGTVAQQQPFMNVLVICKRAPLK
jgi:hypothetical protein